MTNLDPNYLVPPGSYISEVPYLREKGPMGGAPYIGSRLENGPTFEVSLSQLDVKEYPQPMRSSLFE